MLCFIFAIQKILQILWKMFLIPYLYIIKKKDFFVNKCKKQMCFDAIKDDQILPKF